MGFLSTGGLYGLAESLGICCMDRYERTEQAFGRVYHLDNSTWLGQVQEVLAVESFGAHVLVDSAHGSGLLLRLEKQWERCFQGFC